MQYGIDISTYKRMNNKKNEKKFINLKGNVKELIIATIIGFFVTRVVLGLSLSPIQSIAPFGLAFMLASNYKNKKEFVASSFGVLVGYITLFNKIENMPMYLIAVLILFIVNNLPVDIKNRKMIYVSFGTIFCSYLGYGFFVNHYSLLANLISSSVETVVVYPIYYVINYGLKCIDDINTQHYFTNEELISISLLVCFIISGIGGISIQNVTIRNVVAIAFVMLISYITGAGTGASVGLTIGVVLGFTSDNFLLYISVYGVCGMVSGVFKETGKILSAISFVMVFLILIIYSKAFTIYKMAEVLAGALIFLAVPSKMYEVFLIEFDNEKKQDNLNELNFNKIKNQLTNRLRDFTDVLSTMSITLNDLVDNEKLLIKNKSTAMIENVADRSCGTCDMKHSCWKRELHLTYNAFSELVKGYEEGEDTFPQELERKCIRKFAVIKNTEEIINNHVMNEMIKRRLGEGRKLLASHINNMAITVGEIVDDFDNDLTLAGEIERTVKKALIKNGINFYNVFCYNDKYGRLNIKLDMDNCHGSNYCIKDALPVINQVVGKAMSVSGDSCFVDPITNKCSVLIEEAPKYHIKSGVAVNPKQGEKYTGDSYSFGKTKDGHYMVIVSDGMGSGPEAGAESKACVELMEKFSEAGFDELTAIDTVNSIMGIRFSEEEKFTTLDMQKIDLYTGDSKFMKVGAVESFIKRGNKVEVIKSKTLPFGVLEATDIDIVEKKLSNGDIVVTISDGILELDRSEETSANWLLEFLRTTKIKQPKDLSIAILEKARDISNGHCRDDMTVVVSKVIALY
ncbi:stage II sporulation protein E [Clostridium cavendishii DSM 21758]|uniref:Stage II sporulation protein E n=1 Tax=Clostridium cavendishii DSM 21758 TaxID=1121302 RepID=A0A1M6P821_9CLOT|nr:stage II sporulation protein E [Clostridium cavendishii]SHK04059.1 stage II sporulation protein E [Clostridium cavendishii DSM 21758]